jgi:hypothetical protein
MARTSVYNAIVRSHTLTFKIMSCPIGYCPCSDIGNHPRSDGGLPGRCPEQGGSPTPSLGEDIFGSALAQSPIPGKPSERGWSPLSEHGHVTYCLSLQWLPPRSVFGVPGFLEWLLHRKHHRNQDGVRTQKRRPGPPRARPRRRRRRKSTSRRWLRPGRAWTCCRMSAVLRILNASVLRVSNSAVFCSSTRITHSVVLGPLYAADFQSCSEGSVPPLQLQVICNRQFMFEH